MATNGTAKIAESKTTIKPKKERPQPKAEAAKPARTRVARPTPSTSSRMVAYLREVQTELKKTTWPSKAELISSTQIVLGLLVVVGLYIFIMDQSLAFVFNMTGLGMHK